jgi:hypothetical protein
MGKGECCDVDGGWVVGRVSMSVDFSDVSRLRHTGVTTKKQIKPGRLAQ